MKRSRARRTSLTLLVLGCLALLLWTGYDPRWLFIRWTSTSNLPFQATAVLEIASHWRPAKRSSVSLVCSPGGAHLMLRTRLPIPSEWRPAEDRPSGSESDSHIGLGWTKVGRELRFHGFATTAIVTDWGRVDTILTAPLAERQRAELLTWFAKGTPQPLSFSIGEVASLRNRGIATLEQASSFFETCSTSGATRLLTIPALQPATS